jgi:preprotein translocase subunit SecF
LRLLEQEQLGALRGQLEVVETQSHSLSQQVATQQKEMEDKQASLEEVCTLRVLCIVSLLYHEVHASFEFKSTTSAHAHLRTHAQVQQQLKDVRSRVSAQKEQLSIMERTAKETEMQTHVASREQQTQIATLQKEIIRCVKV